MAKILCDIGSLLVGLIAGACIGKYGRAFSERVEKTYGEPRQPINWEEECKDECDADCDCTLDDFCK